MARKIQTKTRRSNNEGSIFQRKSDGKWVGSITFGYDDKGQQKKKTVYGNSQTEVAKKLAEISGRIKSNFYELIESKNFGELMADWLLVFKKSAVSARTFEGIIRNFRLHIEPQIGNMKIYDIDTFVVQKLINNLIEQDYSINVIKKNKHLISQFFEYAIDNKWVSVNPTLKVQIRAKDKAQIKNVKSLKVFGVKLINSLTSEELLLEKNIKVLLVLPENFNSDKMLLYRIGGELSQQEYTIQTINGKAYAMFETNALGSFAFAEIVTKNNVWIWGFVGLIPVIFVGAFAIIIAKKTKKN